MGKDEVSWLAIPSANGGLRAAPGAEGASVNSVRQPEVISDSVQFLTASWYAVRLKFIATGDLH
jgi:hypothetical protein